MGVGVSNWRRTWEKCLVVSVDEIISISIPGTPQWRTPLHVMMRGGRRMLPRGPPWR
jgi:hypothetical protein